MASTPLKNKGKDKSNLEESLLFMRIIESFIEEYSEKEGEIYYYLN